MKAIVFAAGLGTRLGEITKDIPKALVKLGGVPMLQRVLEKLRLGGFGPVVVNACYKADKIEDFLAAGGYCDKEIMLSREPGPEPFETGGGIKFARPLLEDSPFFLAHNVDVLSNAELKRFVREAKKEALANLLVTEPKEEDNRFFLFDESMRLVGWINTSTFEVKGEVKDLSRCKRMSFSGIHLISREVFPLMENWPERFSITDFYISEASKHPIYGVYAPKLDLLDIGSPETLTLAERAVLEGRF